MLRLRLKSFLRQRGLTETELADAIAEALLASGDTVSDRFLRYLTENTEAITPDNRGKTPSLLKLGFVIRGLRHLTGEAVAVGDVLEYVVEKDEASLPRKTAVVAGSSERSLSEPLVSSSHELIHFDDDDDSDAVLDEVLELTVQQLTERGFTELAQVLSKTTIGDDKTRATNTLPRCSISKAIPVLLALFLASLAYIGYDQFILKPLQYERFTRLISFRDRVRPTSKLSVPTLIGPEGRVDQLTPVLRLSEVSGAAAYEFYLENLVSNDGVYSGPVPNSSFPVPENTLCPNTSYEWRARALGEDGWTSFSSPVQFTVSSVAAQVSPRDLMRLTAIKTRPETPVVLAPIGSTNTTTPILQVAVDPDVYGYGFYIRDLQTDKLVYENNFVAINEIQVPEEVLKDGGVYQWNARSRNCHYWSDFTPAQIFTVNVND